MNDSVPKLSVSELTSILKQTLESSFYNLTVEGEVSGFRPSSTGHWYFSLKDDKAVINAAMWRNQAVRSPFVPKDGQKVVVTGSISLYEARGSYQITCTSIRLAGEGDILAKLEQRKRYYSSLGYFDEDRKKAIPKRPKKVAVITSPTGAALQDILQITGRRCRSMDIVILPAVVQGSDASRSIADRIEEVNLYQLADVMIVGRGGGSIEDLLPFSEDCVIEAIHASRIPVISAVGHEIDWAISDFVADLRAPTPSAAAELVCQCSSEIEDNLDSLKKSMVEVIRTRLSQARLRAQATSMENLGYMLVNRVSGYRLRHEYAFESLQNGIGHRLVDARRSLETARKTLDALSPVAVLERGYSIVSGPDGKAVKDSSGLAEGDEVIIRFAQGSAVAQVKEAEDGR